MKAVDFRALESALALSHAQMADRLGISEVSVKRYATGAQPIPAHIAKLMLALTLMAHAGLEKKFNELLEQYHSDTDPAGSAQATLGRRT